MTYRDFYKIAEYMNECNNNIFNYEEVACFAYDYLFEYEQSMAQETPTKDMIVLCTELVEDEDMDCYDYDDTDDIVDLYTMEKIFEEFLENY